MSVSLPSQLRQGMLVAPFVYDGFQARIAQMQGFTAVYMTGFGSAARLGLPDVGIMSFSEMLDNARLIAGSVGIPVVCDADTGFGSGLNVTRTVSEYEKAGIAALHIEDQQWPKRCGYMTGKEIIPVDEMLQKLRAALDTRKNEMMIIARTDALQNYGWSEVEDRARRYIEEGVDMIFVDGIDESKIAAYASRLGDLPLLFNNVPLANMGDIENYPFKLVLHPGMLMAMITTMRDTLKELKETGVVSSADSGEALAFALKALDAEHYTKLASRYS